MSADGKLIWVVNPGGDQVVVIGTKSNKVLKKIKVGDEPQGVAVDPNNRYAYVANAASGNVTVIRIKNPKPGNFKASVAKDLGKNGKFLTGAEPWNIVSSPDGRRIYVADLEPGQHHRHRRDPAGRQGEEEEDQPEGARLRRAARQRLQPGRGLPLPATRHGGEQEQQEAVRDELLLLPAARLPAGRTTRAGRASSAASRSTRSRRRGSSGPRPRPASRSSRATRASPPIRTSTTCRTRCSPGRTRCRASSSEAARPSCRISPLRRRAPSASTTRLDGVRERHQRDQQRKPERRQQRQVRQPPPRRPYARAGQEEALLRQSLGDRVHEPERVRIRLRRLRRLRRAGQGERVGQRHAQLHGRAADHALHRPQRPGQPGHERRQRRQEPAGHRRQQAGHPGLGEQLRLPQRHEGQPSDRPGDRDHPLRRAPGTGIAGGDRRGRSGDVLQLARQLRPARRHDGVHQRAALERCLAVLRELPLQGAHRQRRVVVRNRPAQVAAAERELQPERPEPAEDPQLLGGQRRDRGLLA